MYLAVRLFVPADECAAFFFCQLASIGSDMVFRFALSKCEQLVTTSAANVETETFSRFRTHEPSKFDFSFSPDIFWSLRSYHEKGLVSGCQIKPAYLRTLRTSALNMHARPSRFMNDTLVRNTDCVVSSG